MDSKLAHPSIQGGGLLELIPLTQIPLLFFVNSSFHHSFLKVSFASIEGVDKQAMVEDWLNPESGYTGQSPGYRAPVPDTGYSSPGYRAAPAGYKTCSGYRAQSIGKRTLNLKIN